MARQGHRVPMARMALKGRQARPAPMVRPVCPAHPARTGTMAHKGHRATMAPKAHPAHPAPRARPAHRVPRVIPARKGHPARCDARLGVRVAWENDSALAPNNAVENTLATFALPVIVTPDNPGGRKWVFALHALVQNTGAAAANLTLRCKVNGTSAIGTSTIAVPNGTGERLVEVEWSLFGDNDWNLNQKARFAISGLMAPPTTTDDLPTRRGYTRGASITQPTWGAPIVLTITAQWSTATSTTTEMHGWDVLYYATTPG